MNEIVLLDACVLVPYGLSGLLMTFAEAELFEPRWSERILVEVQRALVEKMRKPVDKVKTRLDAMWEAFPEANVHGFEWMEAGLSCHPKDRHVLAAAIAAGATTLVTTNLKDFPEEACAPHGVVAQHPDRFLLELLLGVDAATCAVALEAHVARMRRPPTTAGEFLSGLTKVAPTFANCMHQSILEGSPVLSDVPAYLAVDPEESPLANWRDSPDWTDPLHVALTWWTALRNQGSFADELHGLTHSPSAFGDYQWAVDLLDPLSIASKVYYAVDDPERVAFVRFVPEVASSSQTFASFAVRGGAYLTMCKHLDGTWRVWGLGPLMVPASRVGDS